MKKLIVFITSLFIFFYISYQLYVGYINEKTFKFLYDAGEYESLVSEGYDGRDPAKLHNYGNAAFQSFSGSSFQNLGYLDQALQSYSGSLKYKEDPITRENYETAKKLLELLSEQDQQQDEDSDTPQEGEGNNDGPGGDKGEEGESNQSGESPSSDTRDQEYFLQDDQQIESFTQEEKQKLLDTLNQIEKQKLSNQRYYGKQRQEGELNSIFDNFFGNIDRGGEKDW